MALKASKYMFIHKYSPIDLSLMTEVKHKALEFEGLEPYTMLPFDGIL